ncbi:S8 family serine peptidase [Alkalicoccobacillus gibsonii]|uniref:S8 family serine peptidase n=1 Tax=Alkalicoccobacillus gibsonii TaxID=79881 RepID=UPI003F7BAD8A
MNPRLKVKLLLATLSIVPIYSLSNPSYVVAESSEEVELEKIYLFHEGERLDEIAEDILETYQNATVDLIDEISTIVVKASTTTDEEAIEKLLQEKYSHVFEESGAVHSISTGDIQPTILNDSPSRELIDFNSIKKDNSNMFSIQTTEDVEDDESLYKSWLWDVELVTNNGASYEIESGNHDVKVGIIDSGIDFNHPDLKDNILSPGVSLIDGITDTQDYMGHGTMVAGAIAANGNVKGIAPNVGIVPYKVFHTGNASTSDVIEAIVVAANDDMDVINLSLGVYKSLKDKDEKAEYRAYNRALKYAKKKNSFVVAASGTESVGLDISNAKKLAEARGFPGDKQHHMPGGLNNVYTVAATNKDNNLSDYSNYGKNVSAGAPGGDYGPLAEEGLFDIRYMTLTTYPTNLPQSEISEYVGFDQGYEFMIGTSLAAPKVSASAAVVIAKYEEVHGKKPSIKEVTKLLDRGAIETDAKRKYGSGIINAHDSLKLIENKKK